MNTTAKAAMPPRDVALELLTTPPPGLSWRGAQFLGNVAGCPDRDLSEAQLNWLAKLAAPAGLIVEGVSA